LMASSKLLSDRALISETFAMELMHSPPFAS
jgi:hypothetical protein